MHVHSAVAVYIAVEIDLFSKGFIAAKAQYTHRRSLPAVTGSIDKRSFCVSCSVTTPRQKVYLVLKK